VTAPPRQHPQGWAGHCAASSFLADASNAQPGIEGLKTPPNSIEGLKTPPNSASRRSTPGGMDGAENERKALVGGAGRVRARKIARLRARSRVCPCQSIECFVIAHEVADGTGDTSTGLAAPALTADGLLGPYAPRAAPAGTATAAGLAAGDAAGAAATAGLAAGAAAATVAAATAAADTTGATLTGLAPLVLAASGSSGCSRRTPPTRAPPLPWLMLRAAPPPSWPPPALAQPQRPSTRRP
jgi:hypothetical protein